jgi:hypothetical protein
MALSDQGAIFIGCAARGIGGLGSCWFVTVVPGKKSTKEAFMPRAQIKDKQMHRELRDSGASDEQPTRIADAAAGQDR